MPQRLLGIGAAARLALVAAGLTALAAPARGQNLPIHAETLENGVTVLIVPRNNEPGRIAAGWVLRFGSADVPEGMSGAHTLIESMLQGGVPEIGTRDIEAERTIMAEQDVMAKRMNDVIAEEQMPRFLAGQIADPIDPAYDTEELQAFRAELGALVQRQLRIAEPNAFNDLYTEAGLVTMAINVGPDHTICGTVLPADAMEFWAWMESARLRSPVFRGFYIERARIWEERREAVRSNPLTAEAQAFNEQFWGDARYAAPVQGDPVDIARLLRPEVRALFEQYMRPERLTIAIVGDVEIEPAMTMARTYFGRLEPAFPDAPPNDASAPAAAGADEPVSAAFTHPGPNLVEVRASTVPFGHPDEPALQVLAAMINRQWLADSLAQPGSAIAEGGAAAQVAQRDGGFMTITVRAPSGVEMDALADGTLSFIDGLAEREITPDEVDQAARALIATGYRRLQRNDILLNQLLAFTALGDRDLLNTLPSQLRSVTVEDIRRVAGRYLARERLSVARYEGTGPAIPQSLDELPPQLRGQIEPLLAQIMAETDVNRLRGMASQFTGITRDAPEQARVSFQFVLNEIRKRIAELEAQGPEPPPAP